MVIGMIEEKTESSFIIHPRTNQRLYRTGDYGRFIPHSYIEFIGRKDFQVKVHGHRIELGEIEYHLQQHPDIHQAIVTVDKTFQQLIGYVMPERYSIYNDDDFDQSKILIIDPIERTDFKLARHGIQHRQEMEKSFSLIKPTLTETLINTYYMRKSYRQFTNEIIKKYDIEDLLRKCHNNKNNVHKISHLNLDFNNMCQLLSLLTPINIDDQPLPKYRYASAGNLYPVQIYIEIHTSMNNISPGLYYHNSDKHSLELISDNIQCKNMNTRLHFIGRSAAIAPLYGTTLGSRFCTLETGYIIGLLQKEASKMRLTLSNVSSIEMEIRQNLHFQDNDTHYCLEISSIDNDISDDNDYPQCLIYLKSHEYNQDQWFLYDREDLILVPIDIGTEVIKEEIPLVFDDHDDTKVIFYNCQSAIFFIGQSKHRLNTGMISHLLMDASLDMNIGMCPIGSRTNLPLKMNNTIDNILTHDESNKENILLHTLLIGKISEKQKYERITSTATTIEDWSEVLKTYLSEKLPIYMIPSYCMTLSTFPLGSNGKIDRKSLPEISSTILYKENTYVAPNSELEKSVTEIWQKFIYTERHTWHRRDANSDSVEQISSAVPKLISSTYLSASNYSESDLGTLMDRGEPFRDGPKSEDISGYKAQHNEKFPISSTTSFFNVGGDSLLLIQLYRHYQLVFGFDNEALTIRSLFEHSTITGHAKLLQTVRSHNIESQQWKTLYIDEGNIFLC